jgi:hypothetical protein
LIVLLQLALSADTSLWDARMRWWIVLLVGDRRWCAVQIARLHHRLRVVGKVQTQITNREGWRRLKEA